MRGYIELLLSSSRRCKYREERLNRRTRLFKAEVCWEEGRLVVKWVEALQLWILPVRWRLGEKGVREESLNRLTQLRFLQGYREEGRLLGLWMEELWLPSHLCRRLPKQVMRGRKVWLAKVIVLRVEEKN